MPGSSSHCMRRQYPAMDGRLPRAMITAPAEPIRLCRSAQQIFASRRTRRANQYMSDDGVLSPAGFASPGRLELAKALRDLIHVAMTAEPRDDATLASITAAARVATSHLAAGTGEGDHRARRRRRIEHSHDDYNHR